jgi:hypothetical protein
MVTGAINDVQNGGSRSLNFISFYVSMVTNKWLHLYSSDGSQGINQEECYFKVFGYEDVSK